MPPDAISTYNGMVIIDFYQFKSTNWNQTQDLLSIFLPFEATKICVFSPTLVGIVSRELLEIAVCSNSSMLQCYTATI
jgi:hypothetical protein